MTSFNGRLVPPSFTITTLTTTQEGLNNEIAIVSDNITRTRSRIVQSPERIKRRIVSLGDSAIEDKRTVAMLEAKGRDLQAKIGVLLGIEKVRLPHIVQWNSAPLAFLGLQDVRGCVEQLQSIEKEVAMLETSEKELADLKDHLDNKKIEKSELSLKQEVGVLITPFLRYNHVFPYQRVHKQFSNAQDKLDRAQRHAEEKRLTSQKTIEKLQKEYDEMAIERKENDKEVEVLRGEAEEIETKVCNALSSLTIFSHEMSCRWRNM
jgi:kinetochore protein Nuf2